MIKIALKNTYFFFVSLSVLLLFSCGNQSANNIAKSNGLEVKDSLALPKQKILTGADQIASILPELVGKNVAIVANQTSVANVKTKFVQGSGTLSSKVAPMHLVDYLHKAKDVNVVKIFSPEHGFRGKADAGELVKDGKDVKTGLPIFSLHGKHKKPSQDLLKNVDVVIFDIQDVGVRFYTYISTLHYVMEACAEAKIPVIVLDRPNPNAHYVDGPTLKKAHKSFVGMHEVPVVYGMTIGEYGTMINGEKWLKNGLQCDLKVVKLKNWTHQTPYDLPIKPSPNLPNAKSINLYPSLGFFEGTTINAGRGTNEQFQRYGAPFFKETNFSYTPQPNDGAKHPKHKNELCNGVDLSNEQVLNKLTLKYLIDAYQRTPKDTNFFGKTFTIHAGNTKLQAQLEQGLSEEAIRATWQEDLERFKGIRAKYLLYE